MFSTLPFFHIHNKTTLPERMGHVVNGHGSSGKHNITTPISSARLLRLSVCCDAHSLSIETMTPALALAKPRLDKANCKLIEPLEILQNNHH